MFPLWEILADWDVIVILPAPLVLIIPAAELLICPSASNVISPVTDEITWLTEIVLPSSTTLYVAEVGSSPASSAVEPTTRITTPEPLVVIPEPVLPEANTVKLPVSVLTVISPEPTTLDWLIRLMFRSLVTSRLPLKDVCDSVWITTSPSPSFTTSNVLIAVHQRETPSSAEIFRLSAIRSSWAWLSKVLLSCRTAPDSE